jgi:hypothetical protein
MNQISENQSLEFASAVGVTAGVGCSVGVALGVTTGCGGCSVWTGSAVAVHPLIRTAVRRAIAAPTVRADMLERYRSPADQVRYRGQYPGWRRPKARH